MIKMKYIKGQGNFEIITLGIRPGEMLLESINKAIQDHHIENGVIISGIGTLKTCHIHYITHTKFPSTNKHITIEKPLELNSISGVIANGKPHLHIVVSHLDKETYGGHLEPGSEVLYLAEVVIMKTDFLKMNRAKGLIGPNDED